MKDKEKVEKLTEALKFAIKDILNGSPCYSFTRTVDHLNKVLEDTK